MPKVLPCPDLRTYGGGTPPHDDDHMTDPLTTLPDELSPSTVGTVLRAAARAPQFSWQRGWQLLSRDDGWDLLALADRSGLTQSQLLSAGATAELLVLGREAAGRRSTVDVLPDLRPDVVLAVRDAGPCASARARELLAAQEPGHARLLQPSDVRHLNLAAESHRCELLWQDAVTARPLPPGLRRLLATADRRPLTTVVSPGDTPHDWVRAGRAVARCELTARALGIDVDHTVHALGGWGTRAEVRRLWGLEGWPQVQLVVTPVDLER